MTQTDPESDDESRPRWWQRAVDHFEAHDLVPYQPPRFEDGTLKHTVEAELERRFGVTITLRCKNADVGDDWTVLVDGRPVGTVGRYRSRDGYTVYEIEPDEFRDLIRSAVHDE
ncbi:hypothetical protein [Halorientalis pallida]|uniref:Uncharacterized protein n=1 Tax=Halorientalis pallida TaxID=2479928 RepID=A0A498KZK0_9EURY|nr:hypothetical protein [Halorientalis pallida]RXK47980.1 hypothetical protein EAF64_15215 [Halorientalis pallida]